MTYVLPDSNTSSVGSERCRCLEVLCQPLHLFFRAGTFQQLFDGHRGWETLCRHADSRFWRSSLLYSDRHYLWEDHGRYESKRARVPANADGCETACPVRDITAGRRAAYDHLPAGHVRDVPRARHVRGYPKCSVPVLLGTHDGILPFTNPRLDFAVATSPLNF